MFSIVALSLIALSFCMAEPLHQEQESRINSHSVSRREVIGSIPFRELPYGDICDVCKNREPAAVECTAPYIRNPHSNTCIRLVNTYKTWEDANNDCHANGENLATFETLESCFWLTNVRKTNSDWRKGEIWIGGKWIDGRWRWAGKTDSLLDTVPWANGQPDHHVTGEECAGNRESDYLLNDFQCNSILYYICEKSS
ncbi:C-type Lectin CRL-like [Watersipora subatra]|uniref:C-type Lectin CRL-like n=1 Tax=Watersipora subatra TaxID=2589382 RepID=UPI00355B06C1